MEDRRERDQREPADGPGDDGRGAGSGRLDAEGLLGGEPIDLGDGYIEKLHEEIAALDRMVEQKDAERRRALETMLRTQDETERIKVRVRRDAERQVERRVREVLLDFVEVLDDCERALAAAGGDELDPAVLTGMELVHRELVAKLAAWGVEREPALGERFDPARHEAVTTLRTGDREQEGRVVSVVRQGYTMNGEVLRPARVVVGARGAPGDGGQEG